MSRTDKHDSRRRFSIADRLKSFGDAFRGVASLFRYEHNARIHLAILLTVIVAGILLGISPNDWMAIILASGLVFISECFNTAIENLADLITESDNEYIRRAKDVAAAGVMLSALISVLVGLIIFIPALLKLVRG